MSYLNFSFYRYSYKKESNLKWLDSNILLTYNLIFRNTLTPMIEITCCGKKKYSASKKDIAATSTVYWGEHIFFEPNNMVY